MATGRCIRDNIYVQSRRLFSKFRSEGVLYLNAFLMSTGFFMLIPLVSVHYTRDLGFTATAVGLALAVRMLTQQGLAIFGGALADRRGYKPPIVAGLLLRSLGFGAFAFAETFQALLVAAIVTALGGALFEATGKAALVALVDPRERVRAFSIYNLASNAGLTLGPVVGVLLQSVSFRLLSGVAAALFVLAGLQTLAFLPSIPPRKGAGSLVEGLGTVWHDRQFVVFTAVMAGYYFVTIQLFITLPLHVQREFGSSESLGLLYATNAGLALVLQYPLVSWMRGRFSPMGSLAAGVGALAVGLALVPLAPWVSVLLACIGLYAAGRAVVEPTLQAYVSEVAPASRMGSYFGFSAFSMAIGGGASNLAAGALYDMSDSLGQPALPWLVMAFVAAFVSLLLLKLRRRETDLRMDPTPPVRQPANGVACP